MRIYLDIETLPSMAPGAIEQVRATIRPPANYKKPETIAAWWADEGEAAVDRAWRRQALDAAFGELCAVGFADDDSEPASLVREPNEPEHHFLQRALAGVQALVDQWSAVDAGGNPWPAGDPFFVAHNAPFDLGFLQRRCWVHGIRAPFPLPVSGRSGRDFGDSMALWTGSPRECISLDLLCRTLGIPSPKAHGDGGDVLGWWQAGDLERIRQYNADDVRAGRACWHRLTFWDHAA
ncbi:MAG: hypothetical protein HT579_21790 [Candidatus Accumulibacter similis]|nr:MAG: hypothetical protein HT579_21790 [Candidatus Accumulibacter similis]